MQPNSSIIFKGPSKLSENYSLLKILNLFKYELIKVLVFLFLFAASLLYVSTESRHYYKNGKNSELIK